MEAFIDALTAFERIHSWWSDETFQKLDNQTMRNFLQDTIGEHSWCHDLASSGTAEQMDQFKAQLLDRCPKMTQSALMNFLDYVYTFDTTGTPFSTQIVAWYRAQGWQFPPFSHEHS